MAESNSDPVVLNRLTDGTVLLVGGRGSNGGSTATAQSFDPAKGTWTATDALTASRIVRSAFTLPDGTVLAIGSSSTDAGGTASAEVYDPRR